MKAINEKQIIISLIKDDMINSKLIGGLYELNIEADGYTLRLSDVIFQLMGFEDNGSTDVVFEEYLKMSNEVKFIDISNSIEQLDSLAEKIYELLRKNALGYGVENG